MCPFNLSWYVLRSMRLGMQEATPSGIDIAERQEAMPTPDKRVAVECSQQKVHIFNSGCGGEGPAVVSAERPLKTETVVVGATLTPPRGAVQPDGHSDGQSTLEDTQVAQSPAPAPTPADTVAQSPAPPAVPTPAALAEGVAQSPAPPDVPTPVDTVAHSPALPAAPTPAEGVAQSPAPPAVPTPALAQSPALPAAETVAPSPAPPAVPTPADIVAQSPAVPAVPTPADTVAQSPAPPADTVAQSPLPPGEPNLADTVAQSPQALLPPAVPTPPAAVQKAEAHAALKGAAAVIDAQSPPWVRAVAESKPGAEDQLEAMLQGLSGGASVDSQIPEELQGLIAAGNEAPAAKPSGSAGWVSAGELDPNVTTATNRQAAMRLNRLMNSKEASKFPHMGKLWSGSRGESFPTLGKICYLLILLVCAIILQR